MTTSTPYHLSEEFLDFNKKILEDMISDAPYSGHDMNTLQIALKETEEALKSLGTPDQLAH